MPWLKMDDQISHHPKFVKAGAVASWLWVCGNCHCNRYLTDGFIEESTLSMLGVIPNPRKHAETLLRVGLWERVDGGYQVHDFLQYNPSRDEVTKRRAEQHEAKVRGGQAASRQRQQTPSRAAADAQQTPSSAATILLKDASSRTVATRAGVPSHPIPSHPEDPSHTPRAREPKRGPVFDGLCLQVPAFLHEEFGRELGADAGAFDLLAWYPRLDAELQATGEKFDTLPWLRARFRRDADIPLPERPLAVRARTSARKPHWSDDCRHDPRCQALELHALLLEKERQPA